MAQSFSLEEALGGAPESTSTPAVGFSLEEAMGLPPTPTGAQAPGPTRGLVSFINEPKKPEEKKVFTGSVFDTQPFEPEFDPAEAARLSRRAYAEETTRAPRRVQEMRATPEDQVQRSVLRAAGDTAIGVLQGAAAIPKGITDNIPFDNPLSQFYKDAYEAGEKSKSGYLRSKNVERAALLDNIRKNQGELAATRGAFSTMFSPSGADIVAQGAGSIIPSVGMSVLNLGTKSMMAMNALANAGDAAQQTAAKLAEMSPEDWSKSGAYQSLREQGMDHRDAVRMLAPIYALPSQVIGGITGAVSGGTGLESALVKGAAKSARARAGRAAVELLGEEAETLAPMLTGNVTQNLINDRQSLLEGLGQAAVETAVASGPGAGLAAAIATPERRAEPNAERMARERGFLVTTPKETPTAPFSVEEAITPTSGKVTAPVAPVAPSEEKTTPAIQRMQEQQRAAEELEGAPELPIAAPAETVLPEKFLHGTSPENKEAILESNKFAPVGKRQYSYSQFGRNAVYFSPEEGWWLNKEAAQNGRAAVYPEQVQARIDPSANIAVVNSVNDLDKLAAKAGYGSGIDLMRALDVDNLDAADYMSKARSMSLNQFKKFYLQDSKTYMPEDVASRVKTFEDLAREDTAAGIPTTAKEIENRATLAWKDAQEYENQYQSADAATKKLIEAGVDGIYVSKQFGETIPEGTFGSYYPATEQLAMLSSDKVKPVTPESWMAMRPGAAEEMEGKPAPLTEETQAELDKQLADQKAALASREEMSKRTAGTSLIKVLKGTLNDGELSELGGRARQVGKNPFLNLKASKGQRGSSMEDMVDSGKLDLFLPDDMRPGHPNYENSESAEYIREKLRNNEFYTYDMERAIARVDEDIESIERQIQELLSEDEINKEIQYAVNEQRELDQAAAEPAAEEATGVAEERAGEEEVLKAQTEQELRDKQAEIDRLEKENARLEKEAKQKAEAPKAEEFVLTGSERAADEAAARGQMELAPAEEAKQPDMAYHSGDLNFGRDTVLGRMMGGRSTGHFGTGVYFVGDKSKLKDTFGLRGGRPIQEIDFSKYNLFKPTTDYSAQRLYEALRKINSLVERDIEDQEDFKAAVKKAVTDLAYATGKSEKSILDAIRNHLEEARSLGEKYAFEDKYIPTLATQVMQDLGYEGVDVRGLDRYDNTEHGSVIYAEKISPVEEVKQPDMEAPLSAENEAALPDYLKAAKDGPDAGEYRFRRLVQLATERGTPINVWSTKDGLVSLAEGVEPPKYARLVATIQPEGQTLLNIEPVGESVAGDASTRAPSLKRKIKTLNKQREEGKISDGQFVNEVDWAVKQDEEQRTKTAPRERVRGADFIRQKLLEAKRRGELSAEGVDLAEWFILQNEALVDDLGIAIKTPKEGGTAGMYNKLARIMVLMKEASNDATIVHEILHHLERMMPAEVQAAIRKEWLGSMLRASREAKSPQEKLFFAALINHHFGSGFTSDITIQGADAGKVLDDMIKRGAIEGPRASSQQLAIEMIRNGMVPYDRYQYVNPSEFWAVRGSDIVQGRFKAIKGGVLEKLKNWIKELVQKIKSIFGLRSDAPLIKALDSLAKADGQFVSKDMLGEGENFLQVGKNIYGRTPLVAWTMPDDTKFDWFVYHGLDKHVDTKRVVQTIEQAVGRIDDKWNPYLQEELFHGRTATETKNFLSNEVVPLLEAMHKEDMTIGDLEEYLHNRFAPTRNENIAKINPLMPDGGSGIKTADAEAYMASLTPEQKAKYERVAKRIDAITAGTRQYLVASGLEGADIIKEWEQSSPDYVPLNRDDVEYSTNIGTGTGLGYSVRGPSSRRATGSERKVVDIFANVIMQRERALVRGEKNRVATALYGLALQNPNPQYWLAVNPDAAHSKKKVAQELVDMGLSPTDAEGIMKEPSQKIVDSQTGLVATRVNPVLRSADNVLGVRINGKDRFIFFNTKNDRGLRMARSLKNLDADQLGRTMTMLAAATRFMASMNTQYNPVFGIYNFLRDVQGGAIQLSNTPIADKWKDVLSPANLAGAMKGIYQTLRTDRARGQQLMTPWADLWIEFQREGGQTGYRDVFSRTQDRVNALEKELKKMGESKTTKAALAAPRWLFDFLSDYNETLENTVRLTAYKAALDKGLSKEQAASIAKNLTVNFNRKGQVATQVGAAYAFFNSSMQGTARLLQTAAKMKKPGDITGLSLSKAGKYVVYGGLLIGTIQAMLLAAAGFDDEEPPDFVKDRSLIIPDLLSGSGKYIAWPMPLGYHVIPAFSRILTEWAIAGGKDPGKRVAHLAGLLMDAFNPIGNAGWSMQSLAPTLFDPLVALKENTDWTGKKIAKKDFNELDPTPGYTRAKQNATWFGKQLSYYLNLASGGDKDKPGIISPTPDQIDYLIGQVAGGVGREVMKATKTAEALRTGEELAPYNIPIVGRFYGDTKAGYAESARFYKNLEEINILENQLQGRQKRREGSIPEFVKENPKVRLAAAAHGIERNIQTLRKQRDTLIEKDAPKERIKAIENRMTLQMKRLNDKVAEMEK